MGQRLIFRPIIVPHPNHRDPPPLQALTPRERYPRFLITCPSEPLSRIGKGGGGKGQMPPQATYGAYLCAVRIEFRLPPKFNPYPALQATGVLGQRPKRILPTFVRTKVGPRRAGVLIRITKKLSPPQAPASYFMTANPPPKSPNLSHQISPIYFHHLVASSPHL